MNGVYIVSQEEIVPAGHKILVRVLSPEEKRGGLILPPSKNYGKEAWGGEVISISPGADLIDAGVKDLSVGDTVITDCQLHLCPQFEIDSEKFALINDGDIVCRVIRK